MSVSYVKYKMSKYQNYLGVKCQNVNIEMLNVQMSSFTGNMANAKM